MKDKVADFHAGLVFNRTICLWNETQDVCISHQDLAQTGLCTSTVWTGTGSHGHVLEVPILCAYKHPV